MVNLETTYFDHYGFGGIDDAESGDSLKVGG
jgi:hypothetical protein